MRSFRLGWRDIKADAGGLSLESNVMIACVSAAHRQLVLAPNWFGDTVPSSAHSDERPSPFLVCQAHGTDEFSIENPKTNVFTTKFRQVGQLAVPPGRDSWVNGAHRKARIVVGS